MFSKSIVIKSIVAVVVLMMSKLTSKHTNFNVLDTGSYFLNIAEKYITNAVFPRPQAGNYYPLSLIVTTYPRDSRSFQMTWS